MFLTIKERLEILIQTLNQKVSFNFDDTNLGFKKFDQLFPVVSDEIKSFPCVAYNKFSDPVKFGVKIIPRDNQFPEENHPSKVETTLLKEFTNLACEYVTPCITFYFADFLVNNKKAGLINFPLKALRHEIFRESSVLISEYVQGGSLEEFVNEQVNITEKQWKFIVFNVAWTLYVLGDRYGFLHNDFHYGNILIDTTIDPSDNSYCKYKLQSSVSTGKGKKKTVTYSTEKEFYLKNEGVLPCFWDFEFSETHKPWKTFESQKNIILEDDEESIPREYNPYFDLHSFMTSILDLNIPEGLRKVILEIYPRQVIPPPRHEIRKTTGGHSSSHRNYVKGSEVISFGSHRVRDSLSYDTNSSESSRCYFEDEICSENYYDYHYRKDSDTLTTVFSESESESESESGSGSESGGSKSKCSRSRGSSDRHKSSRVQTEFLDGDRLFNDAHLKLKLPTPLELINHPYFADYLRPRENVSVEFTYTSGVQDVIKNAPLLE